jgi:1-acyl-sn-glycerol-3-phosphate acyltransferase
VKEKLLLKFGRAIMGTYARLLLDLNLLKLVDLPPGPKIYAVNHPTTTDPFLICLISKEPINILVTNEAFKPLIYRAYLNNAGHIPVLRKQGKGNEIVANAVECLKKGRSVAIFPEGALSPEEPDGYGLYGPHSGVGRLALASGAPVVPVGIAPDKNGVSVKEVVFSDGPTHSRWMWHGKYVVTVGRPLYFEGNPQDWAQVRDTAKSVMDEMRVVHQMSWERFNEHRTNWKSLLQHKSFVPILTNVAKK